MIILLAFTLTTYTSNLSQSHLSCQMSNARLLPVRTASADQSIWRGTKLDAFRRNVVALQYASNKVPSDPEDHSARLWLAQRTNAVNSFHLLPFHVEQRVADDLAFIAAAEEGVKSVSAVALEQHVGAAGLTIRLAANETIPKNVPSIFRRMFDLMSQCATDRSLYPSLGTMWILIITSPTRSLKRDLRREFV